MTGLGTGPSPHRLRPCRAPQHGAAALRRRTDDARNQGLLRRSVADGCPLHPRRRSRLRQWLRDAGHGADRRYRRPGHRADQRPLRPRRARSPAGCEARSRPRRTRCWAANWRRSASFGSYACRNVIGSQQNAGKRSGHAIANAIDVGGFVLKDGRRITILNDWRSTDPATQQFLRTIHASACKRFGTVLSPDYNAAHANHLHLEDDHAGVLSLARHDGMLYQPRMTDNRVPARVFAPAGEDAASAKRGISTPQTDNPAYRLAFQDMDFLLREDLRPVRFQLELLKTQLLLDEAKIASTFVFYGSARIPETRQGRSTPRTGDRRQGAEDRRAAGREIPLLRGSPRTRADRQRPAPRRRGQSPVRCLLRRRPVDHGGGEPRCGGRRRGSRSG